jgi:hypothetical protein
VKPIEPVGLTPLESEALGVIAAPAGELDGAEALSVGDALVTVKVSPDPPQWITWLLLTSGP